MNLPVETIRAIEAHACAEYPRESCGIVLKDGAYIACENHAVDAGHDPTQTFALNDAIYLKHYIAGDLAAIVHSHPEGSEYPTKADMEGQNSTRVPWGIIRTTQKADKGIKAHGLFWFGDGVPKPALIGRGFRHGVTDCYALIRDWYAESGIAIPEFPREWKWWNDGKTSLYEDHFADAGFEILPQSAKAKVGDVFFMRLYSKVPNHAGVYIGNGLILHHLTPNGNGYEPDWLSRREPVARRINLITAWLRRTA